MGQINRGSPKQIRKRVDPTSMKMLEPVFMYNLPYLY
jgi:hypothetical protein